MPVPSKAPASAERPVAIGGPPGRRTMSAGSTGGGHPAADDDEVVRIAVTNAVSTSGSSGQGQSHLMQLSSRTPLSSLVEELCRHWRLEGDPAEYALKFESSREYVTERNRSEVRDGKILKLCQSPRKLVADIMHILDTNDDPQMRLSAYKALQALSLDYALAEELVSGGGFTRVVRAVSTAGTGQGGETVGAQALSHLVATFHEVMKHEDLVSWEDPRVDATFISQVSACIETERSMRALAQDDKTHSCCLAILEALAFTQAKHHLVEKVVAVTSLLNFLQADSPTVQRRALALFNALFRLGDKTKKRKMKQIMEERGARRVIVECIIRKGPGEDMKHQLYMLQALLLNLLEERMNTAVKSEDQKALEKIKELRKLAFEVREQHGIAHPSHQQQQAGRKFGQDYKKLGFVNEVDPTQDFRKETPPGMLALDLMYAFACHKTDQYTKLVLENSVRVDGHECPFARTSIEVVRLLCEIIRIGQPPLEAGGTFFPMFFAHENPLEELFAISIQHINKTWREMRATTEDFSKVIDVAREQIVGALQGAPITMEEYKKSLKTYNEISESRKEQAKNRGEREGKAIQHLRRTITPEILELIQRQRFNFLMKGTRFGKYKRDGGAKDRGKHIFVCLGANQKALHYGDWAGGEESQSDAPSVDQLPHKVPISDLRDLLTGASCPHIRDSNRRNRERGSVEGVALSLVRETGDTLDLLAPDPKAFDYWCDGINALLRREMRSPRAAEDLETLLAMEVKIRLLDVEGIDIPDEPPTIPPLPENFDFGLEV